MQFLLSFPSITRNADSQCKKVDFNRIQGARQVIYISFVSSLDKV